MRGHPALLLALVAGGTVLLAVPFGYWRAGTRRFSPAWFVAVHGGIPLVVAFRLLGGLGWRLSSVVVLASAYLVGQFLGGRMRASRSPVT